LIDAGGLKVDKVKKIMEEITNQVKKNQNFGKELGLSFLTTWIKFKMISDIGYKKA
jgi:hypothetical protein